MKREDIIKEDDNEPKLSLPNQPAALIEMTVNTSLSNEVKESTKEQPLDVPKEVTMLLFDWFDVILDEIPKVVNRVALRSAQDSPEIQ